ncbi:MAG: hypothetical protein Q7S35_11545 [Candidatus Limnocylindrales bacterium]|nr:hypothetical protein [Candidatus Limnocylindrales bacterium]
MSAGRQGESWAATARDLYLVAMAVLLVTVGIGIVNGLDLIDLSRAILLGLAFLAPRPWTSRGEPAPSDLQPAST